MNCLEVLLNISDVNDQLKVLFEDALVLRESEYVAITVEPQEQAHVKVVTLGAYTQVT